MHSQHYNLLHRLLSYPISSAQDLFSEFECLPGAISSRGETDLARYVYIPGTRKNHILLVAHADTVWDVAYTKSNAATSLAFQDGIFYSIDPNHGIGADDRAGCAMLLALADCGHSLLLLNGEEHGKKGAWFLRKSNPALFRELNRHLFIIEFDWVGAGQCLFNQVDNTNHFKAYIQTQLGVCDSQKSGGCDLQVLCRDICGVNLSTGYHNVHSPKETLVLSEWEDTYARLRTFLQQEHPRFPIHRGRQLLSHAKQLKSYTRAAKKKIMRLLNRQFSS